MNFVLGSRGRLGRAIVAAQVPGNVTALDRSTYASWWRDGAEDEIARFFDKHGDESGVVYVATGVLDPKAPEEEHHRINLHLPRNVIRAASKVGLRVVTFGTVMEAIAAGKETANPYILSKIKLGEFVSGCGAKILHIRIHTLYGGGSPNAFMFLGQILASIKRKNRFDMSSGNQLREYHHIDDEIMAINALVERGLVGVVDLSHGNPVALKDMAVFIFEQFGSSNLLNVGALPSPQEDNYGLFFKREPVLKDLAFRETLPAVVEYLRSCETLGEGKI